MKKFLRNLVLSVVSISLSAFFAASAKSSVLSDVERLRSDEGSKSVINEYNTKLGKSLEYPGKLKNPSLLAQWVNWPNWGNWNNWSNWDNWSNFGKLPQWGNGWNNFLN